MPFLYTTDTYTQTHTGTQVVWCVELDIHTDTRYHDTIIEAIRKAVKQIGKEAATHRFTVAEKQEIANIVFTYKNQGVYTSENEISRVAINFIIADYKENGEESVLAKALKALNDWHHGIVIPWHHDTMQPWCILPLDHGLFWMV